MGHTSNLEPPYMGHISYIYQTVSTSTIHGPFSSIAFQSYAGWWFWTFFISPLIGNNHPTWLMFFRGVGIPPTSIHRLSIDYPYRSHRLTIVKNHPWGKRLHSRRYWRSSPSLLTSSSQALHQTWIRHGKKSGQWTARQNRDEFSTEISWNFTRTIIGKSTSSMEVAENPGHRNGFPDFRWFSLRIIGMSEIH